MCILLVNLYLVAHLNVVLHVKNLTNTILDDPLAQIRTEKDVVVPTLVQPCLFERVNSTGL